jgi:type I restriction enzyme S subunit
MEEWKEYKISDIIDDISMGPFGSNIKRENYVDFGVPYLNGSNLSSYKLNEDSFYYVTEDKAKSLGRCVAKRGDIIVTHRGTIGQISYIPYDSMYDTYLTGNSQFRVSFNNSLIRPDFLVYYFHTRIGQHKLLSNASQVGVPALARPTSTFKELTISIPPLNVQNHIMDIILSIDNKIECNKRINEILEQQAQALFKSWFVDFEPFKDQPFVESKLGMIPQGWTVDNIYHYLDVIYGAPYKSSLFNDEKKGLPLIRIRDLKTNSPQFYTPEILPNTEYIEAGDVVAGMDAEFTPYVWLGRKGVLNQRCCKFKGKSDAISNYYILFLIKPHLEFVQSYKTGTTVSHLGKTDIDKFKFVTPPLDIVLTFSKKVNPMKEEVVVRAKESRRLAELRDALLPRLMSGEINIGDINI